MTTPFPGRFKPLHPPAKLPSRRPNTHNWYGIARQNLSSKPLMNAVVSRARYKTYTYHMKTTVRTLGMHKASWIYLQDLIIQANEAIQMVPTAQKTSNKPATVVLCFIGVISTIITKAELWRPCRITRRIHYIFWYDFAFSSQGL